MTRSELYDIMIDLPFDKMCEIYSTGKQTVSVYRPSQHKI